MSAFYRFLNHFLLNIRIFLLLGFICTATVKRVNTMAPKQDLSYPDFSGKNETSGRSERLLKLYRREKALKQSCNPETNVYPCGVLDFLGCSGNKKFYAQASIRLNWFEAWEFCRSHGMHLASIQSKYEQTFMELFLPKPGSKQAGATEGYWLSGTDLGREGQFYWMSSGHLFTYSNWWPGEPNNYKNQEHCIQLAQIPQNKDTMKWTDYPCNVVAYAICQEDYVRNDEISIRST